MKVFLDIGAHTGETLQVVRDPRWGFDQIYCFEPAPECWPALRGLATASVEICEFGLWHTDETLTLHNAGAIGASMSAEKESSGAVTPCEFRDAATWFRSHVRPEDEVYAKINVEGAEAEIIDRLSSAGMLSRIDHLLIHFDVRKVPSKRHLERQVREQLDSADVEYVPADEIQFNGAIRGTEKWLRWTAASPHTRDLKYKVLWRWEAAARRALYPIKKRLSGSS